MRLKIIVLLLVAIGVALVILNPGETVHKKALYQHMAGEAGMDGVLGDVAGDVLKGLDIVPLKYNNYFVYSTMTLQGDTVSVGFLNYARPVSWEGLKEKAHLLKLPGDY
ncbi:MAG: hypothetical protein JXB62_09870 [Pirellulales bacterium]|nr:hypothetical protein [Pirellulales bacterium]